MNPKQVNPKQVNPKRLNGLWLQGLPLGMATLGVVTALLLPLSHAESGGVAGSISGKASMAAHPTAPAHPGGAAPEGHHRMPPRLFQELNLTPEQQQKVKAIMDQGHADAQALHEQLRDKRRAMLKYLQSPTAKEAQARSLNAEINDLQRRLSEMRLKSWFSIRALLTAEQLQTLSQLKRPEGPVDPAMDERGGPGGGGACRSMGGPHPGGKPPGRPGEQPPHPPDRPANPPAGHPVEPPGAEPEDAPL